jgi:hypothetical protein
MSPGASYVVDRRSATYHLQGSNIYKSTGGTKLIRNLFTGDSWLDPSTFRIMFDVRNNAAVAKMPYVVGGPRCLFRRMRILAAGQVVEDIDNYNRVHLMMSLLDASDSRDNQAAEAFGNNWDTNLGTDDNSQAIIVQQALTVLVKPLSKSLNKEDAPHLARSNNNRT